MSEQKTNKSQSKSPNNKKRYNGKKKRPNSNPNNKSANANTPKNTKPSGNRNKNKRKRYNNKKPMTPERILSKYDNLLEQHLVARRKFFELNGKANKKQSEKARLHFYRSIEQLRTYESNLKDWQREVLLKKTEAYEPDLDFSTTHNLPEHDQEHALAILPDGDPHILETQKVDFSHDTEETLGTMEDYESYKAM